MLNFRVCISLKLKWQETCWRWWRDCCHGGSWLSDVGICRENCFSSLRWPGIYLHFQIWMLGKKLIFHSACSTEVRLSKCYSVWRETVRILAIICLFVNMLFDNCTREEIAYDISQIKYKRVSCLICKYRQWAILLIG